MADKGDKYDDVGMLGSYRTSDIPFRNPVGCKVFTGYGADVPDIELGYVKPTIRELPAYDKVNYQDRYTQPMLPSEDFGNTEYMADDFEFRTKDLRTKGFLTRPRIPTER